MSAPMQQPLTVGAFFAWQEKQSDRYELVGGLPVRMMAGAKNVHDYIVVNILGELRNQLRGSGCRPFTGDGSVETLPGQIRRPDVGVDCGRFDPEGFRAMLPRLVVEVLSPSTRDFNSFGKLDEYRGVASMDYVLLVEPNAPDVVLWQRNAEREWERRDHGDLGATVELPGIGARLALRDIYDGIEFPRAPRLVQSEPGEAPAPDARTA